ncbi:MAG TPA: response regulator transcription factor [Herpetosiphonaceae bacterium]|nr:response regulator transcription factor [Herpetosiphonaceae bacterium]
MKLDAESRPVRIIVADDHAVVRAGISAALAVAPNITIAAEVGDGPGVLEALRTHAADALVIDVSMPDFDPLRAIQHIRRTYPALKILVVSAYDDDVYVQGLLGAGVDGYHLKDQPLADLQLAMRRVLAGERWVCSPLLSKLVRGAGAAADSGLTQRQRELLWCLAQGDDNQAIARRMNLSVKTVENHLTRLYRQINVQSRLEAVHYLGQHPDLPLPVRGAESPAGTGLITILLVDDNARYRQHLRRIVGKVCPNALIEEAAATAEAVALARAQPPQLVFADVVLGDEDGIVCAQHIKQMAPDARIILISAYPDREFHRRGLEVGVLALLDKKDLDGAALRLVIEDALDHIEQRG